MASGLKRDPIVILRIDGEDLRAFVNSQSYERDIAIILSKIEISSGSLKDYIIAAFEKLTVDQGMPPAKDPWVMSTIFEPALVWLGDAVLLPVSLETFLPEFKRAAECVAEHLKEQPAIVAHSNTTFDGSGIKRFLSSKFELDKMLYSASKSVPRDENGRISEEHFTDALEFLAVSAGLPPLGLDSQMDKIMKDTVKAFLSGDRETLSEEDFKKLLVEILESIMLQLEANAITVSINSVVHEQITSSSSTAFQQSPP